MCAFLSTLDFVKVYTVKFFNHSKKGITVMKKILAVLCATVLLSACSNNDTTHKAKEATANKTATAQTTNTTESSTDKVSYTIGYMLAEQMKQQKITLNTNDFSEGLDSALSGTVSKFSKKETAQIMMSFQQEMMKKAEIEQKVKETAMQKAALKYSNELLNDAATPTVGPKDAKVAVVEFFDYNCAFCSKVAPQVEKLMATNTKVKFIFKNYPIFASRFESSQYAAEVGQLAYKQGGAKLYIAYHNGVYATGKDEGKLKNSDVDNVAKMVGIKLSTNKAELTNAKIEDQIKSNIKLAGKNLGLFGTPAFIIMPTSGANAMNTTVVPGFASEQSLQEAITKASKG